MKKIHFILFLAGSLTITSCFLYYDELMGIENSSHLSIYFKTDKKHFDKYEYKVDSLNKLVKAWENYSVEKTPDNRYVVKLYDNDLNIQIGLITFGDASLLAKKGKEIQWADSGNKVQEGYYMEGMKVSNWKYYNIDEGYLELEGKYHNNKRKSKWLKYSRDGNIIVDDEEMIKGKIHIKRLQDTVSYKRELDMWNSFETSQKYVNNITTFSIVNEDLRITRIMNDCLGGEEYADKCAKEKINRWLENVNYQIRKQKIEKHINAIVVLEVDELGNTILKIIRGINNQIRTILNQEFEKMNFKFLKSEDKNVNQFFINI